MTSEFVNSIGLPAIVPVPQGGSGANSFVAYMPVIGGSSTTNPLSSANGGTLTAGNVLTYVSGSAAPTWQAPGGGGGGLTWLASVTASTSATLNFDNLLSSSYDNYMIVFENITPDTNDVGFGAQFGVGATPTYQTSGYMGACGYMDSAGPGSIASSTSYATLCTTGLPSTGTTQLSGSININNINNAVNNQGLSGTLTGYYNLASTICSFIPGVQWAGASAVTSIRFLMSAGNILTGTIKLYGLKN